MNSLIEYLKKVKNFRRLQGQRHQLWFILLIVILGLMNGYYGYRALGSFARSQQQELTKHFGICKCRVPSYSTIRIAITGVDWADLMEKFNQWAGQFTVANDESEWLAIDGKSLRYT